MINKEYYKKIYDELNNGCFIRKTSLDNLEYEAIYKNNVFIASTIKKELSLDNCLQETISIPYTIVMFGAGHIASQLYQIFKNEQIKIVIIDPRTELNNNINYPKAECLNIEYNKLPVLKFSNPYFCIFTHGHLFDKECLLYALKYNSDYIGMIGSKTKIKANFEELKKLGIEDEVLNKIHSPIGLNIKGETPFEIAISIAAEIIQTFRKNKITSIDYEIVKKLADGEKGVLCRIIKKNGSGPREVGTMMLVTNNSFYGTIGGGAIEQEVIKDARNIKSNIIKHYALDINTELGMACGGNLDILFSII